MTAAGGQSMGFDSSDLQYMIREHMMENSNEIIDHSVDNGFAKSGEGMHLRWNSQRGRIFIDGSHLSHNLELGDEIMIDNQGKSLLLSYSPRLERNTVIVFLLFISFYFILHEYYTQNKKLGKFIYCATFDRPFDFYFSYIKAPPLPMFT